MRTTGRAVACTAVAAVLAAAVLVAGCGRQTAGSAKGPATGRPTLYEFSTTT